MPEISLPQPSARDLEVQALVLELVNVCAFSEAAAVLNRYIREVEKLSINRIETLFLAWSALDADDRPDFLTFAHHRRDHRLGSE